MTHQHSIHTASSRHLSHHHRSHSASSPIITANSSCRTLTTEGVRNQVSGNSARLARHQPLRLSHSSFCLNSPKGTLKPRLSSPLTAIGMCQGLCNPIVAQRHNAKGTGPTACENLALGANLPLQGFCEQWLLGTNSRYLALFWRNAQESCTEHRTIGCHHTLVCRRQGN